MLKKNELGYVGGNDPEAGQEMTVGGWRLSEVKVVMEQEGLKEKNLSSQKSWESWDSLIALTDLISQPGAAEEAGRTFPFFRGGR